MEYNKGCPNEWCEGSIHSSDHEWEDVVQCPVCGCEICVAQTFTDQELDFIEPRKIRG